MKDYVLLFTKQAKKDIAQLPVLIKNKISGALDRIATNPLLGKALKGELQGLRSFRIGDYRIIYQINKKEILIIILKIGHRKGVYRD